MPFFGCGSAFLKQSTGAVKRTYKAASLKAATVEISEETVESHGSHKFAVDVADGKGSVGGKIVLAEIEPGFVAASLPGSDTGTGYQEIATVSGVVPASPHTVTVADLEEDYGVTNPETGLSFVPVASNPTTGQYAVDESTGVYTFAAADVGKPYEIAALKAVTGSGSTIDYTNPVMGAAPTWQLRLWNAYRGKKVGYYFPSVYIGKGGTGFTAGEHQSELEYEFKAYAAPGSTVFKVFYAAA